MIELAISDTASEADDAKVTPDTSEPSSGPVGHGLARPVRNLDDPTPPRSRCCA